MSSGGWRCIPATFRRNPTNHDKIPTEPAKKPCKIIAKSGQGGSAEPPESVRDASGTHPSEQNAKKTIAGAKSRRVIGARVGFLAIFESRPGAQNPLKTAPGTKTCVRRRRQKRFLSFFFAGVVWSRSPDRFLTRFVTENHA